MTESSDTGVIRLNQAEDFVHHTVELINTCTRRVTVLSTDLEPLWLASDHVTEALRQFAVQNRRSEVRILTTDPTAVVQVNHPWLEVIRRLSRVDARVIKSEILDREPMKGTFVIGDLSGLVYRASDGDAWQGFAHYDDRATVRQQLDVFEQYWRYSEASPEFRKIVV